MTKIANFLRKRIILSFLLLTFSIIGVGYFLITGLSDDMLLFVLLSVLIFAVLYVVFIFLAGEKDIPRLFTVPTTVFLLLTTIIPTLYLLYISFFDVTLYNFRKEWPFAGFQNFIRVLGDQVVQISIIRSIEYVVFSVGIELILGIIIALLLDRSFTGKRLLTLILIFPMMMTPIVVGMGWKYFFDLKNGFINCFLENMGLDIIPWLTSEPLAFASNSPFLVNVLNFKWSFVSMVFVDIWQWTPFVLIIILAGLSTIDRAHIEASMIDGATYFQRLIYIVLPELKSIIGVVILIRVMDAIKAFDTIWALYGNAVATRTLNISIYTFGMGMNKFGEGAALSLITLISIIILSKIFINKFFKAMSS